MPNAQLSPSLQGCRIALIAGGDDPYTPAAQLVEREATLLYYPASQTLPPDNYDELDAALDRCRRGEVDWLLLTTPCAVEAVAERLKPATLTSTRVALYGAKTQRVAAALFSGIAALAPAATTHAEFIASLGLTAESIVAVPVAQRTRADWGQLLLATGAETLVVPAYRLLLGRGGDDLPGLLWGGLVDAIVFLTENSVRHFTIRLKTEGGSLDMLNDVVIATLDIQTAAAAQRYDLQVHALPAQPDDAALADALARHFSTIAMRA